jgi:hypothetical protein
LSHFLKFSYFIFQMTLSRTKAGLSSYLMSLLSFPVPVLPYPTRQPCWQIHLLCRPAFLTYLENPHWYPKTQVQCHVLWGRFWAPSVSFPTHTSVSILISLLKLSLSVPVFSKCPKRPMVWHHNLLVFVVPVTSLVVPDIQSVGDKWLRLSKWIHECIMTLQSYTENNLPVCRQRTSGTWLSMMHRHPKRKHLAKHTLNLDWEAAGHTCEQNWTSTAGSWLIRIPTATWLQRNFTTIKHILCWKPAYSSRLAQTLLLSPDCSLPTSFPRNTATSVSIGVSWGKTSNSRKPGKVGCVIRRCPQD